jgi:hypothetical protein
VFEFPQLNAPIGGTVVSPDIAKLYTSGDAIGVRFEIECKFFVVNDTFAALVVVLTQGKRLLSACQEGQNQGDAQAYVAYIDVFHFLKVKFAKMVLTLKHIRG